MKSKEERKGGFAFRISRERLKEFRNFSAEDKLDWLEEANKFVNDFVPESKLARWRKLFLRQKGD